MLEESILRDVFKDDRFVARLGIQIDRVADGVAVCSVPLQDDLCNAMHIAHGGLIYTLADFAFAVASNSRVPYTVTLNSSIHYFKPPKGKVLVATAVPKSLGKSMQVYEIMVVDGEGRDVAVMTATGYSKGEPGKR